MDGNPDGHSKEQKEKVRKRCRTGMAKLMDTGLSCNVFALYMYWEPTHRRLVGDMHLPQGMAMPDINKFVRGNTLGPVRRRGRRKAAPGLPRSASRARAERTITPLLDEIIVEGSDNLHGSSAGSLEAVAEESNGASPGLRSLAQATIYNSDASCLSSSNLRESPRVETQSDNISADLLTPKLGQFAMELGCQATPDVSLVQELNGDREDPMLPDEEVDLENYGIWSVEEPDGGTETGLEADVSPRDDTNKDGLQSAGEDNACTVTANILYKFLRDNFGNDN